MGWIIKGKFRFSEFRNERQGEIVYGGRRLRGYLAEATYVNSQGHPDDEWLVGTRHTIFSLVPFAQALKVFAPSPPFQNGDGIEEASFFEFSESLISNVIN